MQRPLNFCGFAAAAGWPRWRLLRVASACSRAWASWRSTFANLFRHGRLRRQGVQALIRRHGGDGRDEVRAPRPVVEGCRRIGRWGIQRSRHPPRQRRTWHQDIRAGRRRPRPSHFAQDVGDDAGDRLAVLALDDDFGPAIGFAFYRGVGASIAVISAMAGLSALIVDSAREGDGSYFARD